MSIVRTALVLSSLVAGTWLVNKPETSTAAGVVSEPVRVVSVSKTIQAAQQHPNDPLLHRRLRIERVLLTLDQVAAVALQMTPEHSSRVEPVLVDLAEQTLELIDDASIRASATDDELDRIEETLMGLMTSINRMTEPEMTL